MSQNTGAFVSLAVVGVLATFIPAALTAVSADAAVTPSSTTAGQSGSGTVTTGVAHLVPPGTYTPLPLGDPNLIETRTTMTLAKGVTRTHIVCGTTPTNRRHVPDNVAGRHRAPRRLPTRLR